jgi:hypothetical protein
MSASASALCFPYKLCRLSEGKDAVRSTSQHLISISIINLISIISIIDTINLSNSWLSSMQTTLNA